MNELTFVSRLSAAVRVRREARLQRGEQTLIVSGDIEEREIDPRTGKVVRCDMRLNAANGRKLASGEFKRPEHAEGRDPRGEALRADARRKAIARGLTYYFTCNMARVVLYALPSRAGDPEKEIDEFELADVRRADRCEAVWSTIETNWLKFLDYLEERLQAIATPRPSVTREGVIQLKTAIDAVVNECLQRVKARLERESSTLERTRATSREVFGLSVALNAGKTTFVEELAQVLRLSVFVITEKLILYRVLSEAGPRRTTDRFSLDKLEIPEASTDALLVYQVIQSKVALAQQRSRDFETAFLPTPHHDILFTPAAADEVDSCRVGAVWANLARVIEETSWATIAQNLVGFLYETVIDPRFRHELGQYYTREDVVDLLAAFAVENSKSIVLDPASGGGGFLRAAYQRKTALGATHEEALGEIWGCEITAFAAQLSALTLATAQEECQAAYPLIVLRDFFTLRAGAETDLDFPGSGGRVSLPPTFDAIIGNPPYIQYRRMRNHDAVASALEFMDERLSLPQFSGKSDAYIWFIVYSTALLSSTGRLAFVVSSSILFADYGVPVIRFLGRHYRIVAIVDSMVEQWFEDADTNTVLLFLQREDDEAKRRGNLIRFVRLRQPLSLLIPGSEDPTRREQIESLVGDFTTSPGGDDDPRFQVNVVLQGDDGGLEIEVPHAGAFESNEDVEPETEEEV